MPLGLTASATGTRLANASNSHDGVGVQRWVSIANAIATWVPANTLILPGTLASSAGAISGFGAFSFPSRLLGATLAQASQSFDSVGIARWVDIGEAILTHLEANGQAVPTGFSCPVPGGPVVGALGTVLNINPGFGPALAVAAQSIDGPGQVAWTRIGGVLMDWFTSSMTFLATPIGLVAPASGPLTGSGTIL